MSAGRGGPLEKPESPKPSTCTVMYRHLLPLPPPLGTWTRWAFFTLTEHEGVQPNIMAFSWMCSSLFGHALWWPPRRRCTAVLQRQVWGPSPSPPRTLCRFRSATPMLPASSSRLVKRERRTASMSRGREGAAGQVCSSAVSCPRSRSEFWGRGRGSRCTLFFLACCLPSHAILPPLMSAGTRA